MARPNSKKSKAGLPSTRRTSIWDAVIAATVQGWSATLRLCVLLLVIGGLWIAAALLGADHPGTLINDGGRARGSLATSQIHQSVAADGELLAVRIRVLGEERAG